ncbi:hypothetical protein GCM10007906_14530 [Vibrio hyugaensis]|uniref:Uncharacterized protein n=1 Tax=Vibrio hyugaensis TaxID=1534743 RepID=A0ABQ5Y333_9VIBR|nr:hypothetical protein [Vibrio hyugaensis]GLR03866.1 hypothetical protein GCM10007906_14530 [Vibrio hyugaensis]
MKLNTFFLVSATAMTMVSGAANAADEALADAIWSGVVGGSVPSSNLIITGESGGDIQQGTLYVNQDGTFTSSNVVLEARDYNPETQEVGLRQPEATWTYVTSQVLVGNQVTQEAVLELTDNASSQTFTQGTSGQVTGGYLQLSVTNNTEITDVPVEGEAQVIVQMAASYVEAL